MNLLTSCGSDFCLDPLDCPHREKVLFMSPLIYRMNRGSLVMGCVRLTNTPLYMCTSLFLVLPMACGGFNFSGRKDKASENLLEFRVRQLVLHPKIFFSILDNGVLGNSKLSESQIHHLWNEYTLCIGRMYKYLRISQDRQQSLQISVAKQTRWFLAHRGWSTGLGDSPGQVSSAWGLRDPGCWVLRHLSTCYCDHCGSYDRGCSLLMPEELLKCYPTTGVARSMMLGTWESRL